MNNKPSPRCKEILERMMEMLAEQAEKHQSEPDTLIALSHQAAEIYDVLTEA